MLEDFARYYTIAKEQGNIKAMEMIKAIILSLLNDN